MKRMIKASACGLLAAAACLSMTGCSSSAPKHLKSYFNNVSVIMGNLTSGQKPSNASAASDVSSSTATQLDTPQDFTVSEDGSYTFTGVENATQYIIYFCDPSATEDGDDYLYSSSPITANSSNNYSGKLADIIDAAYGDYLVKVYAFPDLTDTAYAMSGAAKTEYVYSGAQSDPQIAYYWNAVDSTMDLQLANVGEYTFEAYPKQVDVTFTNVEDDADIVNVAITDITADSYSVTTDALKKDVTYKVEAVSESDSEYVTNAISGTVTVADEMSIGAKNLVSEDYTWSDGGFVSFPRVCEAFPLEGGSAGKLVRGGGRFIDIECTPTASAAGADYTYDMVADFGGFTIEGSVVLNSDGTMVFTEGGGGPIAAGSIEGTWVDNGDGTAWLNYVPANIKN